MKNALPRRAFFLRSSLLLLITPRHEDHLECIILQYPCSSTVPPPTSIMSWSSFGRLKFLRFHIPLIHQQPLNQSHGQLILTFNSPQVLALHLLEKQAMHTSEAGRQGCLHFCHASDPLCHSLGQPRCCCLATRHGKTTFPPHEEMQQKQCHAATTESIICMRERPDLFSPKNGACGHHEVCCWRELDSRKTTRRHHHNGIHATPNQSIEHSL